MPSSLREGMRRGPPRDLVPWIRAASLAGSAQKRGRALLKVQQRRPLLLLVLVLELLHPLFPFFGLCYVVLKQSP